MKVSVSVGAAPPDVGDIRGKYGPRCLACGRKIPGAGVHYRTNQLG